MADERDFELLDDYLTNRMREQDRAAFEQRLQADPDLQNEFALQQRLVKGIKDARIAELKSMLNNIPVSATGPEKTLAGKIALGTVLSILIAAAAYWYFNRDQIKITRPETPSEVTVTEEKPVTPKPEQETKKPIEQEKTVDTQTVETDKNQTSAGTEHSKPSQAKKPAPLRAPQEKTGVKEPALDVFDPAREESENENKVTKENQQAAASNNSTLTVETDTENRRYTFHYQFKDGKLFLYGPFEKNLYEIMEFFSGEKRTVFLYHKDNYYLLEERDVTIWPLTPITDPSLLKKLKEYRSSK